MASTHTLTGNVYDLTGATLGATGVRVTVVTNLPAKSALIDKTTNSIHLGGKHADLDPSTGLFTIDLIDTSATDLNVAANTLEYEVRAEYVNPATRVRSTWTSGWFPFTADANLADITTDVEPLAVESASGYALEAKGYRDETEAISGLTGEDAAVAFLVEDSGSATAGALSATYATVGRQVGGITSPRISNTVTTFAAGHGFTMLGTTAASVTDDATTFAVGTQSLAVVTKTDASAASVQKTTITAFDATGKDLVVTVRVTDVTNLNQLMVYATSDATFASHYVWTIQDGTDSQRIVKSGEWQTITLSFADATVVGTPNRAALTVVRLRAGCTTGNSTTIRWNRVGLTPAPSAGVVSICVDDIYASTYTLMRPILDKYGFGATCYAIPERATAEFVTLENLHKLEDVNGWEIAAHGLTNLTTMTLADAEADLIASRTWLMENGFKGIDHYAYPQGGFSPAVEAVMRRLYRSGRTIISKHETSPPSNPYRLRSLSVVNTTPVATVTAAITKAAAEKSWFILTLHDIVTSGADTGTKYLQSDLDTICAHIASTGLAVKTVGDVIAGL